MKALIFGTGSIGSVYGYVLHKAGVEVTTVCRSNYDQVLAEGIEIRSALWGEVRYRPGVTNTVAEASEVGSFDYVFVCTKAIPGNAILIKHVISPKTAIVLAQNGLGIEGEYADEYPDNTIISGVVFVPAHQISPGIVNMGPRETFDVGTYPVDASASHKARVSELVDLWKAGGGNATLHDDVQGPRWRKLCLNATFNTLCTLGRLDTANLLLSSDFADGLIVQIIVEIGQVATTVGYGHLFSKDGIDEMLSFHRGRKKTGAKEPSMLADVRAGRPIEIESIIGNVLRIAQAKGLTVPRLEMLYVLLKALDFGREKPDGIWKQPIP